MTCRELATSAYFSAQVTRVSTRVGDRWSFVTRVSACVGDRLRPPTIASYTTLGYLS